MFEFWIAYGLEYGHVMVINSKNSLIKFLSNSVILQLQSRESLKNNVILDDFTTSLQVVLLQPQ